MELKPLKFGYKLIIVIFVTVLCGFFLVGLALPRLANNYNFALPGANGLPYRISFNNRTYINPSVCAGADRCKNEKPACLTGENLTGSNHLFPQLTGGRRSGIMVEC
jgi:hypothetical protein